MAKSTTAELAHLEWAIESRSSNQQCSLALLRILETYPDAWKTKKRSKAAQSLVAVAFSLWRAAFLADKTAKREAVLAHGRDFLRRMIEDNAISYATDRKSRDWTFNYYVSNARYELENLAQYWPGIVQPWKGATRTPTERWTYANELLTKGVDAFAEELRRAQSRAAEAQAKRARRQNRKAKRRIVRALKEQVATTTAS